MSRLYVYILSDVYYPSPVNTRIIDNLRQTSSLQKIHMIPNLMNFTTNKDEKRCFPIDRPDPFVSWRKEYLCSTGKLATPSILMKRTRRDMSVGDTYMQQQASRISPLPRNQRFPFSLDCETIFYRGALALRIYYICNGLRKLRQSANISHDLHLHDSPFYARSFKPSRHVNHNREPRLLCIVIPSFLSHND